MNEELGFDLTQRATAKRLQAFAEFLQEIQGRVGFKISARGWAYQLEMERVINKNQFDKAEKWVNLARRDGFLPIDFVAEEPARAFSGVHVPQSESPEDYLIGFLNDVLRAGSYYTPDWWSGEKYYAQMVVEKIDIMTLFEPVCNEYHIPIATSKGWSSMLQRAEYARRFQEAEEKGLDCILLYFGDHDPDGLRISDFLRKNLEDVQHCWWTDGVVGYNPSNLIIERFGLSFEFIEERKLTWIDNLETSKPGRDLSNPKHPNHKHQYVQDYLGSIGARKCEANALVPLPEIARAYCRETIEKHLGKGAKKRFAARRQEIKDTFEDIMEEHKILKPINKVIEKLS